MRTSVLPAVLSIACIACSGAAPPAPTPPAPSEPVARAPSASTRPSFPGAPASPSGDQLAWVLDAIVRRHGKVERSELEAHFHASFLASVAVDKLRSIFEELAPSLAGVAIGAVKATDDDLVAHVTAGAARLRISLSLDPGAKTIRGLLIQQDVDVGPGPQSFDEVRRAVAALAPRAQFLVAELDHGTCRPLHDLAADQPLAIGATFKLYVLLALADRILAGKAAWSDELAVRDDWKSLPSGITQNEPPGTRHSLAVFAERMISISDNTAADHLLYWLGRKEVEAALRASKHARPTLDTPMLSTRELFLWKLGTSSAELTRYLKLPEAGRRAYLDKALAQAIPHVERAAEWKAARQIDAIEWFASSADLCRLMATLHGRGQSPKAARLLDILAKKPGVPIDPKVWPYVGFKGGSEPGVLNLTYLLRRDDGRWFVASFGFNADEGGTVDDARIYPVVAGAIRLLGAVR
jgi:beta-lactamase class A